MAWVGTSAWRGCPFSLKLFKMVLAVLVAVSLAVATPTSGQIVPDSVLPTLMPLFKPSSEPGVLNLELVDEVTEKVLSVPLNLIKGAPKDSKISFFIDSPGGDVVATLTFMTQVQRAKIAHNLHITCTTGALVASCAAFIFEGICDERIAEESTVFLFHQNSTGGGFGSASLKGHELEDSARLSRIEDHALAGWVGPKLHMTIEQYLFWLEGRDRYLTADELKQMGGVDQIISIKILNHSP